MTITSPAHLPKLVTQIRQCTLCAPLLPQGPNPVFQIDASARILIAGQAPGKKVHESGVPFDDASGDRLRHWLGMDRDTFYDAKRVAILPMGFCYPGTGQSGDLPPRPECARQWRAALLDHLPHLKLTIVIGSYALAYHLPQEKSGLTVAVQNWQKHWPSHVVLPHPSGRNNIWLKRHPWFEQALVPVLNQRVQEVLNLP